MSSAASSSFHCALQEFTHFSEAVIWRHEAACGSFSPNGMHYFAGSADGRIVAYNMSSAAPKLKAEEGFSLSFEGHKINSMISYPAGVHKHCLVVAPASSGIHIFDIDEQQLTTPHKPATHLLDSKSVLLVQHCSKLNFLYCMCSDGHLRVISISKHEVIATLPCPPSALALTVSHSGRLVACASADEIALYSLEEGSSYSFKHLHVQKIPLHASGAGISPRGISFSPIHETSLFVSFSDRISVYEVPSLKVLHDSICPSAVPGSEGCLVINPHRSLLLSVLSSRNFLVYDLKHSSEVAQLGHAKRRYFFVAISPCGKYIAAHNDSTADRDLEHYMGDIGFWKCV